MFIVLLFCCFGQILASQVKFTTTENPECDCGKGAISCTFNNETGKKQCDCEDGYAFDSRDFENKCWYCKDWCNENAKTCAVSPDGVVGCVCKDGFKVEKNNYQCEECDCGPNGNCTFRYGMYRECQCDAGFEEDVHRKCSACDCGPRSTKCYFSLYYGIKSCNCEDGFKDKMGTCEKCDCGPGEYYCYFDSKNGSKICTCKSDKYFLRNGFCEECDCYLDVECEYVNNTKHCFCPAGFENKNNHCQDINECLDPRACAINTRCENSNGTYDCFCKKGYESMYGDDDYIKTHGCRDIDECYTLRDPCGEGLRCENLQGSYDCLCGTGYFPENVYVNPRLNNCFPDQSGWVTGTIIVGIALGGCIICIVCCTRFRRRFYA